MLKTFGLATTLAFTLAAAPALAQSAPTTPAAPTEIQKNETAPMRMNTQGAQTSASGAVTYITQQTSGEHLSSNLISKAVYNSNEEEVGKINDLVIDGEGRITAAVIGVGGFLGMGEKDVAVPFAALQQTVQNGSNRILINATKADLEKAPAYTKLEDRG